MIEGVPEVVKDLQYLLASGQFAEGALVINCTPDSVEVTIKACQQLEPVFQEMGIYPVLAVERNSSPERVAVLLTVALVFLSEALSHFTSEQACYIRERFINQARESLEAMSPKEAEAFCKTKFGKRYS